MIKSPSLSNISSHDTSSWKRGSTIKNEKVKYVDISCGKEHLPINLNSKERTKLIKKFDYINNYITDSQILNKQIDDYLLPKSNCCDCVINCLPESCPCISSHAQIYECNENCKCGLLCSTRIVQNGITKKLLVKYINKSKGFGVFADEDINKGEFVCEYIGIIISKTEAENKINLNHKKQKSNYILQIKEIYSKVEINTYIDAETFGGVGRFINHSCDPNLYFEFVRISHFIPHVAFYANRKILKGEELTFMYCDIAEGDSTSSLSYKKCECGAKNCKKFIPN